MTTLAPYATATVPSSGGGGGVAVDPGDPNQLAEPLRSVVIWLIGTGRVTLSSGRRSTADQFELRGRNGCAGREYDRRCKGNPTTAIPGSSKHERGEAADLGGDLSVVRANAARLGIYQPMDDEPWHWQSIIPGTGGALGAVSTAAAGSGGGMSLTEGHTYIRLLLILGGTAAVVAGGAIIAGNTKTGRNIATVAGMVA